MRFTAAFRAAEREPLLQMVKTALATVLAWIVADVLVPDGPPPVFAAIAAMLVVQPSLNQSLTKGVERSLGVIAGVFLASALSIAFGDSTVVVLVAVVAALAASWVLRLTAGSSNQIAISALLVLALGAATPGYATYRVLETFIGAAIGIVVHIALVPPVALTPARRALDTLGEEIAASLERLAAALSSTRSRGQLDRLLASARELHEKRDATFEALDHAEDTLALNPRSRNHRKTLAAMRESTEDLRPIVTQVIGMTRAFVDQYDDDVSSEPAVQGIAEELRRAAHDVRRKLRLAFAEQHTHMTFTETAPALTAPLMFRAPSGMRWILVGSLMEDLRRIREELGART